ncbi:MAG: T9SS type A sorting domain-containing protein [Flavobacteriales bacterium]
MLIFICSNASAGPAKTVYSITNNGSVTNGSDWSTTPGGSSCSCTPDFSKDVVNIRTNINSSSAITVQNGATLNISNNVTFNVTGKLTFNNGSIVNVASGSTLYASGDIENKNNSNHGSLSAGEDFIGGSGSTLSGSGTLATVGTATLTGGSVFGSTTSCTSGPCAASASNPLPVKLVSCSAKLNDDFNLDVKWSTASDINNDYFVVERSKDASYFEPIATINGAGNSNQIINYYASDEAPLPGISFYRLKQVDFDGTTSYSSIVMVNSNAAENRVNSFGFTLYPNPTNNIAHLSFFNIDKESEVMINVYDLQGKNVHSSVQYVSGEGSIASFDASTFDSGIYIVNTTIGGVVQHQKLVVTNSQY